MRRIILSYVGRSVLQYFSTFSHKRHDLRGGGEVIWKMRVLISPTNLSATFLILKRTERDTVQNEYWTSCKVPLLLSDVNATVIFATEKYPNIKFYEIRPVGAELFHADGRVDRQTWRCLSSLFAILRKEPEKGVVKSEWELFPLRLDNGRSQHAYVNQRLQIQFRDPDDERYAARNMLSLQ